MITGGMNVSAARAQKKQENEELVDEMEDIEFVDENGNEIDSKEKDAAKAGFNMLHKKLFVEGKSIGEASKAVDNEILPEIKYKFAMERLESENLDMNDDTKVLIKEKTIAAQETIKAGATAKVTQAIEEKKAEYQSLHRTNKNKRMH